MKYLLLTFIVLSTGIWSGCADDASSIKRGNRLDLEAAMQTEKKSLLSALGSSMQCIPLETNDSSLLGNRAYLLYADEQYLFVSSKEQVYRFQADGRFLNRIGQRGSAPGEYNRLYAVSVDSEQARLLYYVGHKRVQFWGYDGRFQKEIGLQDEGEITTIELLGDKILSESRVYSEEGLKTEIHLFDLEGKLLKEIPVGKDVQKVDVSMRTTPLMYVRGRYVKYKDANANALLSLCGDSAEQQWIFDLGKFTPSRELLEDVARKETLMRDFAQLVDVQESDRRFYFLIVHGNALRGIVVDKKTGQLAYSQTIEMPQKGGGIENDYIDQCCFWPSFISDSNVMYCLLPIEKITSVGKRQVEKYSSGSVHLAEEANPVVLKVHGK